MRKLGLVALPAVALGTAIACGPANEGTPDAGTTPPDGGTEQQLTVVEIDDDVTSTTTWTKDKEYHLKKHVFVVGATLTIEPGTVVKGASATSLVVTSSGKLVAAGTREKPIVFTSAQAEGDRAPGDWGGVVLLGKAPINVSGGKNTIEGFPVTPETEALITYGGSDAAHDCGRIEFARIEFAGFELAKDNELNGLTMGGCGAATVVDHLQVHKGADDGVEVFGGTVNLKHVLITQPDDDGLDWDFGWTGKVQFLAVQQNALVGNYGFEADSNKNAPDAAPRSQPEIWNVTLVGSDAAPGQAGKFQGGMLLRRGTAAEIHNSIVAHFADQAIDVDGHESRQQAESGALFVKHSIFFDNADSATWPAEATDNDEGFDEQAFFKDDAHANRHLDPQLTDAKNLAQPNLLPRAGSPALSGGATPAGAFFDASATFVGAFGTEDWTAGWTAFPAD